MAIAGIDDLTTALKSTLAAGITGLSAYAIEPASPKYPAAWVFFRQPAIEYTTFDGGFTAHLTITIAVQGDVNHMQTNLQQYLDTTGSKSVKACIEADPDLGLTGVYATVLRVEAIGPLGVAGSNVWAATFPLDLFVAGA